MTRLAALLLLAAPLAAVAAPALKPGGDRLLYVSGDPGEMQIWTVKDDGTGPEKLTTGEGDHLFPAWSPDGKQIAYSVVEGRPAAGVRHGRRRQEFEATDQGIDQQPRAGLVAGRQEDRLHRHDRGAASNVFVMDADGSQSPT